LIADNAVQPIFYDHPPGASENVANEKNPHVSRIVRSAGVPAGCPEGVRSLRLQRRW
jgi:hypothetical protein